MKKENIEKSHKRERMSERIKLTKDLKKRKTIRKCNNK